MNRFNKLALLPCATLAFAVVGTGAAQAVVTPKATQFNGVCEAGEFCLYHSENQRGLLVDFGTAGGRACDHEYEEPFNNNTRSYWNRSTLTVRLYDGINYGPPILENVAPGRGNLAEANWDRASSHRSIGSGC
jgi:hypothetical protein